MSHNKVDAIGADHSTFNVGTDSEYKKKSRGCTTREKILCAVIVIFIVICVVLAALLITKFIPRASAVRKEICTSPTCVTVAGGIVSKMDLGVEPCTDFYKYACGRWIADVTLPPDKSMYGMFTEVYERNTARVRELLASEGNELHGQESTAIKKAKDFYKTCLDKTSVETKGIEPMMKLIKDLGSWPATAGDSGTWNELSWNLFDQLIAVHKSGGAPLFGMGVGVNLKNVDENIIQFDQSGLSFGDPSFYLDETMSKKYYKTFREYFATIVVLLGGDNSTGYQIADDIWQFEKLIANITTPREDRQDNERLYHKMTVGELQDKMGDWIDISEYLKYMFGYKIESLREIVVYEPVFLSKIGGIATAASKRTLASYMVWHGMSGALAYLPYPFQQADLVSNAALFGVSARPPDWKICLGRTGNALGQASGALFVEKYFSAADKEKVEDMLETIKDEFRSQIPKLNWMDEETKKKAIEKVDAVDNMIGFPEMAQDPPKLDTYYEKMVVTDNNAFQNYLNVITFYMQRNLGKLSKKPDKKEWHMSPDAVNAYYSSTTNQMVFPAGILQYPFYDPSYPFGINYGAIGTVMGHELTHGFDSSGRQFDKDGNLKTWWTQSSLDNFLDKAQCIINQYDQFTVGKKNVNGKLTQNENIADNGGIKAAYGAYQRWLTKHGSQEEAGQLPALNMTESQAFFLGFGQISCAYITPQIAENSLVTDTHSPPQYRVFGSLNNMQEFSDAFHCPPGTPMNPKTKCVVW